MLVASTLGEEPDASACTQMPTGVISCWRAEGDAFDSAGNNNGVLLGDATYGTGRVGRSFVFDGDQDGVMVGTATNLHSQNFTIEAWIKRASATVASFNGNSNAQLFVVGTDPGGLSFALRQSDNRLMLNKSSGNQVISDATIADTDWHHVAVTKQEARVVFYLDGKLSGAAAFEPGNFTFSAPACIGAWFDRVGQMHNSFYGLIDELAIYDRELASGEILTIYKASAAGKCPVTNQPPTCLEPPPGLLSWWRAEEYAFDSVGANHGTLVGGASYATGKVGKGFLLGGPRAGVCIIPDQNLHLQDFSLEAWIRRSSSTVNSFKSNGVAYIFSLGAGSDGIGFQLRTDGSLAFGKLEANEVVSSARVADTNWHHLILTKSGSTVIFYVDAVGFQAPPYDSGRFTILGPGYIGARLNLFSQVDDSFRGTIDEVSFYGRPLSAAEVLSLFNAGRAGKCFKSTRPQITLQPRNQTVTEGDQVTQIVAVTGSPPLSYQWRRYGTSIVGSNGPSLVIPAVQPVDAGMYSVVITNLHGTAVSSNAVLVVNPLPDCAQLPPDLVSWWKGESNTADVVTRTGGILTNHAGYSRGRIGLAFSFNGDNQLVEFPDAPYLNPTHALTLECWINVEQFSTNDCVTLASKGDSSKSGAHQYGLGLVNFTGGGWAAGALLDLPGGLVLVQGTTSITLHKWCHVAMTYDGSAVKLYVDGILDGSVPAVGLIKTLSIPFQIGGQPTGPWSFNGRVDELSLYHRALTPAEIQSIYNAGGAGKCPPHPVTPLPAGLFGWWAAESNAVNSVNGVSGAAPIRTSYAPGKVGTAFCFDGTNQPVRMANAALLNPTNGLTLECWVNVGQLPTNEWVALAAKKDPLTAPHQYMLGLANVGGRCVPRAVVGLADGKAVTEGTGTISVQSWYHMAMTYDGAELRLYFNGVLDGTASAGGPMAAANLPLLLGGDSSDTASFKGRLDEVCLYDRALSSKEVAANYLAGRAGKSLTDTRPSVRDLRKWLFGGRPSQPSGRKDF